LTGVYSLILWDFITTNRKDNMRTDRKKDLDRYYNDHLKMQIMRRFMMVETWSEIMGIQSAVFEAISREENAERAQKKEFEEWKKNNEADPA